MISLEDLARIAEIEFSDIVDNADRVIHLLFLYERKYDCRVFVRLLKRKGARLF